MKKAILFIFILLSFSSLTYSQNSDKELEKDYYFLEANKLYLLGDLPSSYAFVKKSIEVDSLCAACYYLQSQILLNAGEYTDALSSIRNAYSIDSTNKWYLLLNAQVSTFANELDAAKELYSKYTTDYGYSNSVYLAYANILLSLNQPTEAKNLLDTMLLREGFTEQLAMARQHFFYRTNNLEDALPEAISLYQLDSLNPQYITILADIYVRKGDLVEALAYYNSALATDSLFLPAMLGKLDIYSSKQQYDNYFSLLESVCMSSELALKEKLQYLGMVIGDQNLRQVGTVYIESILLNMRKLYGSSWQFFYFSVSYYMNSGNVALALQYSQQYVAGNSTSKDAWSVYLSVLQAANFWSDLLSESTKATSLFTNDTSILLFKVIAQWQLNDYKSAIKSIDRIIKLADNDTTIYNALVLKGDIYQQAGNSKNSFKEYDKALKINPNGVVALNNYAYHLSELNKDLPKALSMSKRVMELEPDNPTYIDTYGWIYYKMGLYEEAKAVFRKALVHGGKSMSVVLEHFADVLVKLKEFDTAVMYLEFAIAADDCEDIGAVKDKIEKIKLLK